MARSSLFPASVQPGKPILPPCPPGWTTVTFGDVLEIVERPIDLIDNVEYQLVTAKRSRGGVVARSRLLGRDVLTKTQFLIARDDFLMSNRQIIHGGCGIVPPSLDGAVVSNEYSVLRPKSKLLLEFLGYLTHSIYFQQTCFHASVGVDVEKMIFDCERWLEFGFHLPPLHEQRRIAEILSSVDEAIAVTRALIEQTKKVKQGVLERLLTKGIGHTRFKQTEIGELPEGWEVTTLGEVVSYPDGLQTGPFGSQLKAEEYVEDGIPVVMPRDLIAGVISTKQISRAAPDKVSQLRMHVLRVGDIVFARRGDIGRFALTSPRDEGFLCGTGCLRARLNVEIVLPEFASAFLESDFAKEWLNNNAVGQTMLNLNTSIISRLPFVLPHLEEQTQIVEAVGSFGASLPRAQKSLSQHYAVKSALMSDLLTGSKRVTDALPMAAE